MSDQEFIEMKSTHTLNPGEPYTAMLGIIALLVILLVLVLCGTKI